MNSNDDSPIIGTITCKSKDDYETLTRHLGHLQSDNPALSILTELLRLYDWRNELGKIERDFNHDKKQMKTWLNQYGREKKVAWITARDVVAQAKQTARNDKLLAE